MNVSTVPTSSASLPKAVGDPGDDGVARGRAGPAGPEPGDRLRATDVLFGRGTGPNNFIGNIRFRALVSEVLQDFPASHAGRDGNYRPTTMDAETKNALASEVLELAKQRQMFFLQKLPKTGGPPGNDPSTVVLIIMNPDDNEGGEGGGAAEGQMDGEDAAVNSVAESGRSWSRYLIVPEAQVLSKIKQSLRFQLESRQRQERLDRGEPAEPPQKKVKTERDRFISDADDAQARAPGAHEYISKKSAPESILAPRSNAPELSRLSNHFGLQGVRGTVSSLIAPQAPSPYQASAPAGTSIDDILLLVRLSQERERIERLTSQLWDLEARRSLVSAAGGPASSLAWSNPSRFPPAAAIDALLPLDALGLASALLLPGAAVPRTGAVVQQMHHQQQRHEQQLGAMLRLLESTPRGGLWPADCHPSHRGGAF